MTDPAKILTVSELTKDIKQVLENVFEKICVCGEISNLRQPASGHVYFSLKDEASALRCVIFKGSAMRLRFSLQDGLKVVCDGRIGVYERDGQYQLYVTSLAPKGQGELQLAFDQLKKKLFEEGLFDEARKKELPFLPQTIGLVTSSTGAVLHDILHVLSRRFEKFHLILYPVRVQGTEAAQEIVDALDDFNKMRNADVLILARGGGSLEDLWSFNEESVARAIARSSIPVISAIGHETDFTIADFVSDRRAPTPSAAAEIVMPALADLQERVSNNLRALWRSLADIVPQQAQRIDDLTQQMQRALVRLLESATEKMRTFVGQLDALSPLAVLKRGYSVTTLEKSGKVLVSGAALLKGDRIRTRLSRGVIVSEVLEIERQKVV